jgi:hypothetical protein
MILDTKMYDHVLATTTEYSMSMSLPLAMDSIS